MSNLQLMLSLWLMDYAVELRDTIRPSISSLVELLKDKNSTVRSTTVSRLGKMAEHCEFEVPLEIYLTQLPAELRGAILDSISSLIDLLKDENSEVRSATVSTLAKLAGQGRLLSVIL